jgi:hypothetical protein
MRADAVRDAPDEQVRGWARAAQISGRTREADRAGRGNPLPDDVAMYNASAIKANGRALGSGTRLPEPAASARAGACAPGAEASVAGGGGGVARASC